MNTELNVMQTNSSLMNEASEEASFNIFLEAFKDASLRDLSLAVMGNFPLSAQQIFHLRSIAADETNPQQFLATRCLQLLAAQLSN